MTLSKERLEEIESVLLAGGLGCSVEREEVLAMARELLERRERAEPVGEVVLGSRDDEGNYPHAHVICLAGEGCADWDNFPDGFKLYAAAPAPVVPDAYEIIAEAWRLMDGMNPETSDWHTAASLYLNACRAAIAAPGKEG